MKVNIHEAKTQFSRLLARVAAGEEVIITRAGLPVARLVPLAETGPRPLGLARGKVKVPEDFDAPLPTSVLEGFDA